MLYKTNLLIRRNCVRQGKASEGNEAVVTYVKGFESPDNEVYGNLYNQHSIPKANAIQDEYAD